MQGRLRIGFGRFREGLSKTLRLLGCSQEDVAQYLASGEVAKRYMQRSVYNASLSILENVFPRMASGLVTPVIHPDNLETAVKITLKCTYDGLGFLSNGRDKILYENVVLWFCRSLRPFCGIHSRVVGAGSRCPSIT